jgi:hypothetical protein
LAGGWLARSVFSYEHLPGGVLALPGKTTKEAEA